MVCCAQALARAASHVIPRRPPGTRSVTQQVLTGIDHARRAPAARQGYARLLTAWLAGPNAPALGALGPDRTPPGQSDRGPEREWPGAGLRVPPRVPTRSRSSQYTTAARAAVSRASITISIGPPAG